MAGPAALAVQTGAALMPVILWFEGDGWGVDVGAEIPVPDEDELGDRKDRVVAMTQELARFFEAGIREHPHDWLMLQRVFVADLDPERQARAEQRARSETASRRSAGRRALPPGGQRMRIGLVCPYTWEVPGGVREHVSGLAEALIDLGHDVSVIAPADDDDDLGRTTSCPPGARCRCPTTARWPGSRSASCPRAGCGAGSRTATSTSCTCTSPPRRACRCWPAGSPTGRSWPRCTRPCRAPARCTPRSRSWPRRWRRSAAGSRSPRRPGPRWSSTWAATRC